MTPTPKTKQHVPITWERASLDAYPIVAYMVIQSSLPKFKWRKRAAEPSPQMTLLEIDTVAVAEQNTVESGEREDFMMRLPYTREALVRRKELGRDIPAWIAIQKEDQ